jgi:hypothetical protein
MEFEVEDTWFTTMMGLRKRAAMATTRPIPTRTRPTAPSLGDVFAGPADAGSPVLRAG